MSRAAKIPARRARGYILLPVAIAIALIAAIAYMSTRESSIEVNRSASEFEDEQLEYLAQAGLQHALYNVNNGSCSAYALPATDFGEHSYQASFSPDFGSPVKVTASATLDSGPSRSLIREQLTVFQAPITDVMQPGAGDGKDTHIYQWKSTWNFGTDPNLVVVLEPDSKEHSLLQFDLGAIPAEAKILSASLELYSNGNSWGPAQVDLHRVTSAWTEGANNGLAGASNWQEKDSGVPWASPGGDYDVTVIASANTSGTFGWHSWDVSPLAASWVDGSTPNYGLLLRTPDNYEGAQFSSSDASNASLRPKLTLTYACECGEGTASSWLLQPGAEGKDTLLINGSKSDNNTGAGKQIWVSDSGGTQHHGLIEFDISALPANVQITNATLKLYSSGPDAASADAAIGMYRVTTPWVEGSGAQTGTTPADGSTWDRFDGVNVWSIPGGDYDPSMIDSSPVTDLLSKLHEFDVTSLVAGWANASYPNYGVLIKTSSGTLTKAHFSTGDEAILSQRPILTIDYICPCGAVCATPGGGSGGNVLFVVGDDAVLTAEETAHQGLLESWGYTLQLIDDDATQVDFDAAVADNSVAFATNDIDSASLASKLVSASIGVVTSEANLSDEFGMASTIGWESDSALNIQNNSHYISLPFASGNLEIFTVADSLAYLGGTLSPDLELLASSASGFGIATLAAGANLYTAGTAAGNRVQLPWGGGGFSLANLNDDGRTILRRALEWAASAAVYSSNIVMVVGDPLAPTPGQIDKQALMESWGHSVTLIEAAAPQSELDAAADAADVVYIPELGAEAMIDLGTRADNLAVALITEESRSAIKLGSFLLDPFVSTNGVNIVDNSHYLSEGLPLGNLVLSSSVQSFWRLGGTLATDLHTLAEFGASQPALAYIDTGELLNDDSPAPARRVKLPWGAGDEFDISLLTAEAQGIMRRAIEWGAAGTTIDGHLPPGYYEMNQQIQASNENQWELADLSAHGVPPNAVVEVAIMNGVFGKERIGGVRAVGSSLDRRINLHEAEPSGDDSVTMHVQADSNSQIEINTQKKAELIFRILGFWSTGNYVEAFDSFAASASASWSNHDLGPLGVPAEAVVELAASNSNAGSPRDIGFRSAGSSLERRLTLQEAESGGVDAVSAWVKSDGSSQIEVYAESNGDIEFHLLGYWSTAPGTYTEAATYLAGPGANGSWENADLSGNAVPAEAVVQIVLINAATGSGAKMGVRQTGSAFTRIIDLHEAENGGSDLATMQVKTDSASSIEWIDHQNPLDQFFSLVGWWEIAP